MRVVPEVVFVNCCHSGFIESTPVNAIAANVATQFVAIGVRCVIAAGWAVSDGAAETFAKVFYSTLSVGPTTEWEKHKLWNDDPIMLPYKQAARTGRFAGYEGPSTRKAAEVVTKYIIVDMYAKAVQGMPAEEAVKWAHGELVKIYGA